MAETKVLIVLDAKDHTESALRSVQGHLAGIGQQAAGVAAGMLASQGLSFAMGKLAEGISGTISASMEFEKTMSGIKAVSGATGEEFADLSKLALQLGKDTAFSASEAAMGMEELIKGGVSLEDIMNGAASATLDLAAAGGVRLPEAAEIAANAMAMFNLKGEDMRTVADAIAGAANASSISVTDFKFSLGAVGAVANLAGQSFEDTATAIAVMGAAGIKGSDAGTSLKTMLMNLQPESKRQIEAFKELGLRTDEVANAFIDAEGNFKSLRDIAGILNEKMKDLTNSQKAAYLEAMFGSDAIRAAAIMAEKGAEGFDRMWQAMSNVKAAEVAKERLNNLAGDVQQLQGSAETFRIMLGGMFTPALREFTQTATDGLNNVITVFEAFQDTAGQLGIDQAIEEQGQNLLQALQEMAGDIGSWIVTAAGNFAQLMATWSGPFTDWISVAGPEMLKNLGGVLEKIGVWIWDEAKPWLEVKLTALGTAFLGWVEKDVYPFIGNELSTKLLPAIGSWVKDTGVPWLIEESKGLGGAIVMGVVQGLNPIAITTKMAEISVGAIRSGAESIRAQSPSQMAAEQIGEPISAGIAMGVEANSGLVGAAVTGLLSSLFVQARNFLVTTAGAPSQLAATELGAPISAGIGAGIQGGASDVYNSLGAVLGGFSALKPAWRLAGEELGEEFLAGLGAELGAFMPPELPTPRFPGEGGPGTAPGGNFLPGAPGEGAPTPNVPVGIGAPCPSGMVQWSPLYGGDGQCYTPWQRGPCPSGMYLDGISGGCLASGVGIGPWAPTAPPPTTTPPATTTPQCPAGQVWDSYYQQCRTNPIQPPTNAPAVGGNCGANRCYANGVWYNCWEVPTALRSQCRTCCPGYGFALGGVVPGPMGAAVLATVHGGERIIPAWDGGGSYGGGGGGIDYDRMAEAMARAMGSIRLEANGRELATVVREELLRMGVARTNLGLA